MVIPVLPLAPAPPPFPFSLSFQAGWKRWPGLARAIKFVEEEDTDSSTNSSPSSPTSGRWASLRYPTSECRDTVVVTEPLLECVDLL